MPELAIRVNGRQAAYLSYHGSSTARDRVLRFDPYRSANTSASVLLRDSESRRILLHLLFDVGLGVVNSLEADAGETGSADVDALFLTHPHLDHYAELDRLAHGLRGAHRGRGDKHFRLPLYCTAPCAERVIGQNGSFYWVAAKDGPALHRPIVPCEPVEFSAGGETVTVTPVSVFHGPFAQGAVIYVVQACGRKVIFGWDLLRLVEAPEQPLEHEKAMSVTALPLEHAGLVRDADVVFLDSTTWHPRPSMGHISILEGLALTQQWRTKRLYWTHYAGNEDLENKAPPLNPVAEVPGVRVMRPLTDPELHWLAGRVSTILNRDVRYAYPGMTIPDTESWPDAWPPVFGGTETIDEHG